ncbi:hypothetical protein M427DRAFT_430334 [Gonapodya prolifera JEL478]|uniref:Uncharacterized protein n=1 Tax=Gonapodya prolifera (strain JEL478) TaxID=1344416 RepID=A0A139AT04_GONPJ|nr:hypothetical protein M427DRAFT_430334 [Gonapodya prolifera JEL478]|eukprot:KXS19804.1 hypothetical protein M427DRAFT_430334 [Gonapodya prolifera JEL478]
MNKTLSWELIQQFALPKHRTPLLRLSLRSPCLIPHLPFPPIPPSSPLSHFPAVRHVSPIRFSLPHPSNRTAPLFLFPHLRIPPQCIIELRLAA